MGLPIKFIHGSALAQCFIHDELSLARRLGQELHQLIEGFLMKILGKAKSVAAVLQRSDSLLEGFLVSLTNTHNLANGTHLCSKLVLRIPKFLEGPTGEFNHYVVPRWRVFLKCAFPPIGNLIKGQTGRQH